MTLCVVTSHDDAYRDMGALCAATLRAYADRHGMDCRVVTDMDSGRPPAWNKIPVIRNMMEQGCEFVLWVDTDAQFIRFDDDVRSLIKPDKHLYLASHHAYVVPMPGMVVRLDVPNSGVMLLRNHPWTHALLDAIWAKDEYLTHKWWENAALIDLMGYRRLLDKTARNEPDQAVMRHVEWLDWNWNSTPGASVGKNPIINHYTRQTNYATRLDAMRRDHPFHDKAPSP
jgi:hypothetical protein